MKQSNVTIAVLSGKGGTGKTLLSVNLAAAAQTAVYADCDVEEPNGHLFFKPEPLGEQTVSLGIPLVDERLCSGCRACVDFCRFNALAFIKSRPVVFPSVCHACGGCALVCPTGAISEVQKPVGTVSRGVSDGVWVHTGMLQPGEASGVPLIRRLLSDSAKEDVSLRVIDCPPGSACAVMESVGAADYCVLVAEPTIYGAHNLAMVHELVELLGKPFGVVLNKCTSGENPSEAYCATHALPIVGRIDFDPALGALVSEGTLAARAGEPYRELFSGLLKSILKEAGYETALDSQR